MGEVADGLLAADDGAVRAGLGQELMRVRGAAEPATALGIAQDASAEEIRARFLALVKLYHPNRFARRPPDIIKLANEVFLQLRRAYQRLGERAPAAAAVGAAPGPAQVAAPNPVAARASEISPPSQPKLDVDAALAARRRRPRSQPAVPATGTVPIVAGELMARNRRREEEQKERFETALADLISGRLPSARSALRTLVAESPADRRYRAYLHYVTGRMHESAGRASEAVVEYDRALGFDPDLELARGSRELLTGSPGGSGAGRFGRWFRK